MEVCPSSRYTVEAKGSVSLPASTSYVYSPLESPGLIRIAELKSGNFDSPIQISLQNRSLSDLPTYSAISYEWGANIRQYNIFCAGKAIKVTSNLVNLLLNLRSTSKCQLLWIDAICINQDDIRERSLQVSLMGKIYRGAATVLMYIGSENEFTQKAFQIIPRLSEVFNNSDSIKGDTSVDEYDFFKQPEEIAGGKELEWLTREPVWTGVMDVLNARSYFSRLWIIQEIVLASKVTVVCGGHQISWELFKNAARLIRQCAFLNKGAISLTLTLVILLGELRESINRNISLSSAICSFGSSQVSNPLDSVYGFLGILREGPQKASILVDYNKSPEQVFQEAMTAIIVYEQSLIHWRDITLEPNARLGRTMPSWVPYLSNLDFSFAIPYVYWITNALYTLKPLRVTGDILYVQGLIVDSITQSSVNISARNMKAIIQSALKYEISTAIEYSAEVFAATAQRILAAIHLPPHLPGPATPEKCFFYLVCLWALNDFEIASEIISRNPDLGAVIPTCPELMDAFPEDVKEYISVHEFISKEPAIKWMIEQTQHEGYKVHVYKLIINLYNNEKRLGRNLFRSINGLLGVGPAGGNDGLSASPAVQVGDLIVLVAGMNSPVILRPDRSGCYIFVGLAHVGNLVETSVRVDGKIPDLVELRIR